MNTRALFVLLIFVTAVHSYCNPIADLCAAAGIACPTNGDNTCTFNNSTTDFDYFDVICSGHLYLPTGFIKGRAAMGHDFNKEGNSVRSDVNIGAGLTPSDREMPYSLICASDISWPYGELYPVPTARVFYTGRRYSTPKNLDGRVDTCTKAGCLNSCFSKMRKYHESLSTFIAQQSPTATTSLSGGVLTISCTSSSSHYFVSIKGSTFSSVTRYSLSSMCNHKAIFAFNIEAGSSVVFKGTPFSATGTIYNIAGSETATINSDVYGTILNARGNMNQNGGTIYGRVLAGECPKLKQIERPLCSGSTPSSSGNSGTQPSTSGLSNTTSTSQSATSGNPYTSGSTSGLQNTTGNTSENPYTSGSTSSQHNTTGDTSGTGSTSGLQNTTGDTSACQNTTSGTQSTTETTASYSTTSENQSTTSESQTTTSGSQTTTSGSQTTISGTSSTPATTLPTQNVESSTGGASTQTPSILFFLLAVFCVSFFITS